jgi:hypothetical protein
MLVITREDFGNHYHMTVEFKVSASLREEPADGDSGDGQGGRFAQRFLCLQKQECPEGSLTRLRKSCPSLGAHVDLGAETHRRHDQASDAVPRHRCVPAVRQQFLQPVCRLYAEGRSVL